MEDYMSNSATEVAILRRKLQSKAEALIILTQELEQCRTERDQLKLIAEQNKNRCTTKRASDEQITRGRLTVYPDNLSSYNSSDFYLEVREQNKTLRYEIQDLKQKLREAYGDIKVLRAGAAESSRSISVKDVTPAHQREELVEQLERMSARVNQLETDLRAVLDEKEELINERESYRGKVVRLNHQLNVLLRGDVTSASTRLIDLDTLLMDHKYVQEQLQQLQAEKELALQALHKYKSMLEKKKNKGSVRLGSQSSTMVVSHKQVQELLERGTAAQLPNTEATLADLKSLCMALLEALQDKTLALTHQRKANKILAARISELEQRVGSSVSSQMLLQSYFNVNPDRANADVHTSKNNATQDNKQEDNLEETEVTTLNINESALSDMELIENEAVGKDSLPEDIQELVTKALEELREESKK